MSDFPSPGVLPLFISSMSRWTPGIYSRITAATTLPAALTWVSNQTCYIPLTIPWSYPVNRVWWVNGSTITSTNVDMGIYTVGGNKIYSTGSTAMSGASSVQYVTPGTPFILSPGRYYLAWQCNNTTSRAFALSLTGVQGAMLGLVSESVAGLPASMTPVTFAAPGMQYCGITRTSSGF